LFSSYIKRRIELINLHAFLEEKSFRDYINIKTFNYDDVAKH
jgi:hypothetical protein